MGLVELDGVAGSKRSWVVLPTSVRLGVSFRDPDGDGQGTLVTRWIRFILNTINLVDN